MSQTIICPNCSTKIDLDQIANQKYNELLKDQEKKLREEQAKQKENFELEMKQKEDEMRKKAIEFAEKKALEAKKEIEFELKDVQEQLQKAQKDREESRKKELEFMKKQRELEDKEKNFELEMEKKLFDERKKIENQVQEKFKETSQKEMEEKLEKISEDYRKKELENYKQQEQMRKTIDDLKRKSEQWSQQIQWDISEDDLKNTLSYSFPHDDIEDVPTWVKWADLLQTIKDNFWQSVWIIVWESKNTKSWTDSWIMKLKDDKLKVNWNIAILVTSVLPKWVKHFWLVDDIMVCTPDFAIHVAWMLRDKLLSISKVEKSMEWKDAKMEMLYKYLSSEEFSSKMNMMIDVFANLKSWIDAERRSMEKNWKKREKDLERATFAVSWMYWELESLMWQSLPWSKMLELDYDENDDSDEDLEKNDLKN